MHAPIMMEYIAEQKQQDLARKRGRRDWKALFSRVA